MPSNSKKSSLTSEEEKDMNRTLTLFNQAPVEMEQFFELFNEWQSLKTRSLKRFVLSLSFILTISLIVGMKITEIDLFGISVNEGNEVWFLSFLIIIHVCSFSYYWYHRSVDQNVSSAKVGYLKDNLSEYIQLTKSIDKIISKKKATRLTEFWEGAAGVEPTSSYINKIEGTYKAISFFNEKLSKEFNKINWAESIKKALIWILAITGLVSIFCSYCT